MTDTLKIVFDGTNADVIQKLFGRMQNMDGDVDVQIFQNYSDQWMLWDEAEMQWNLVEVGDILVQKGVLTTRKYGVMPVTAVIKPTVSLQEHVTALRAAITKALVYPGNFTEQADYFDALVVSQEVLRNALGLDPEDEKNF